MKWKIHRRNLSLFEVVIAFFLFSILLTALFSLMMQVEQLMGLTNKKNQEALRLNHLQSRLRRVMMRVVSFSQIKHFSNSHDAYFFTEKETASPLFNGDSLVFVYDNGPDIDPHFSNFLLGKIFLAKGEHGSILMLASWPLPSCQSKENLPNIRLELLQEEVTSLSFRFFGQNGDAMEWLTHWDESLKAIPEIVEIECSLNNEEFLILAFPLPNGSGIVNYIAS